MATYSKYHSFVEAVSERQHNLGADTLRLALSNSAPNQTFHTGLADVFEITPGNGYSAGGNAITITGSSRVGGTYFLQGQDVTFTASGGPMNTFRYVIFYNDTSVGDLLISSWDVGSGVNLNDGESLVVDFGSQILSIL